MFIPRRTQYALRAVFELCKRQGQGPVKITLIARSQDIPVRFLEVILGQLKQPGFIASKRGNGGGYYIACDPADLTVGEVIRFLQGPVRPVGCSTEASDQHCSLHGQCVFLPMWEKIGAAIAEIYDHTTFRDLVDADRQRIDRQALHYTI